MGRSLTHFRAQEIDWFRAIVEIERAGIPDKEIAKRCQVPTSTVWYWKQGREPRYQQGVVILAILAEIHTSESVSGLVFRPL